MFVTNGPRCNFDGLWAPRTVRGPSGPSIELRPHDMTQLHSQSHHFQYSEEEHDEGCLRSILRCSYAVGRWIKWMETGHGGPPRVSNMVKEDSERTWPQFDAMFYMVGIFEDMG